MAVWFTSDTHFGHANIIKYCKRPFESVEEMDETLVYNWNSVIRPGDSVYHLGDLCFHRPDRAARLVSRLMGQIFLVKGNHDRDATVKAIASHLQWVKDYFELKVDGQRIVLCHFPFLTWNKSHHGSWHLHGHSHGTLPDDPNACRIDVGVDCHTYAPVSFERVKQLMETKDFKPVDHHGRAD
jgi:calcineurin-like phosphoesterase family protein